MLNINELQELQNKKIEYFFKKVGIRDIHRAERYLTEANWDEKLAVANFNRRHNPNYNNNLNNNNHEENQNNQDIQFQRPPPTIKTQRNNSRVMKKVNESEENYIALKMTQSIEDHKFNNGPSSQSISFLKYSLKPVEQVFNNFLKTKKNLIHIILIYTEEAFNSKILNQIKTLKKHNLYSMLEQNAIIFPVLNKSPIGKELSKQFLCISFPSCLFCKFRDNGDFCVINRMEGVFDVSFFYECVLFEENKIANEKNIKPNSSKNNVNVKNKNIPNRDNRIIMNENKNPNNFINELRQSNYFNENYENPFINHKEKQIKNNNINQLNQKTRNNNKNRYNNRDISKDAIDKKKNENIKRNITQRRKENENDKINNQNYNQEFMDDYFLGNSQDLTILLKKIYGEQNNNDNNNNNKHNDNHNDNHNQNDEDIKYRNNNKINNKNINNNININNIDNNNWLNNRNERNKGKNNSNKNINKNYNDKNDKDDPFKNVKNENLNRRDNMLADSIYGLTDAQILAKRENEIRELERQQEEKEKKEEEEKRKILEEENRIKNLNNKYEYEAKVAKMILPQEPDENNPNACYIKFRLPDGEKIIERRFLKTDKIATLYDYVKSIGREIFMEQDSHDFDLIGGGFPPKNLGDKKNNTLEEEDMFPNFILQIREK